jgi:uncharacterized protein YecE (DUF72 family)
MAAPAADEDRARSARGLPSRRALRSATEDLQRWRRRGDAYAYFNNDLGGCAVRDALDLLALLGEAWRGG